MTSNRIIETAPALNNTTGTELLPTSNTRNRSDTSGHATAEFVTELRKRSVTNSEPSTRSDK